MVQLPGGNLPSPTLRRPTHPSDHTLYIVTPRHIQTPTINQWTVSVQQDSSRLGYPSPISATRTPTSGSDMPEPRRILSGHIDWCHRLVHALTPTTGLPKAGAACSSTTNSNNRTVLSLINPVQGQGYSPTMTQIDDGANSSYNGLLAVIHRMSNSFQLHLANYPGVAQFQIPPTADSIARTALRRAPHLQHHLVASSHFTSLQADWRAG